MPTLRKTKISNKQLNFKPQEIRKQNTMTKIKLTLTRRKEIMKTRAEISETGNTKRIKKIN